MQTQLVLTHHVMVCVHWLCCALCMAVWRRVVMLAAAWVLVAVYLFSIFYFLFRSLFFFPFRRPRRASLVSSCEVLFFNLSYYIVYSFLFSQHSITSSSLPHTLPACTNMPCHRPIYTQSCSLVRVFSQHFTHPPPLARAPPRLHYPPIQPRPPAHNPPSARVPTCRWLLNIFVLVHVGCLHAYISLYFFPWICCCSLSLSLLLYLCVGSSGCIYVCMQLSTVHELEQ